VGEDFPSLHNPDDSGIDLVLAILKYVVLGLLFLLLCFFDLNSIDLDLDSFRTEISVKGEGVLLSDLLAVSVLENRPQFPQAQRGHGPLQLIASKASCLLQLGIGLLGPYR